MSNHLEIIHKTQHNKYVKHQSIISRNVQCQTTCATPPSSFISHFWHQIVTPRTWTIIQKEKNNKKEQWMCHAHHAILVQTVTWRSKGQEYAQPSRTHYTACPKNVWSSQAVRGKCGNKTAKINVKNPFDLLLSVMVMTDNLHQTTKTARIILFVIFVQYNSHADCSGIYRELMKMFKSCLHY